MSQSYLKPTGLLRLNAIIAPDGPIPVSRSSWHRGVADGRYPKPIYLGSRITCWKAEDIQALIDAGIGKGAGE
jgi:prophage regulatory protein